MEMGREMLNLSYWLAFVALAMVARIKISLQMEYSVGDKAEWKIPTVSKINYTEWVAKYDFHVEDTLHFRYEKNADSVLEVKFHDYEQCETSNPVATYTDGNSIVYLLREGSFWFISGIYSHCILGEKFSVNVSPYRTLAIESAASPGYLASSGKGSINRGASSTFASGPSQQAPLDSASTGRSSGPSQQAPLDSASTGRSSSCLSSTRVKAVSIASLSSLCLLLTQAL